MNITLKETVNGFTITKTLKSKQYVLQYVSKGKNELFDYYVEDNYNNKTNAVSTSNINGFKAKKNIIDKKVYTLFLEQLNK